DGGTPNKVYDKQGACQPHWAPSGKTLVYETETHVCTINPDGTKNRVITYYGGVQRYARFSPDGTKLIFCQAASPEGPWELYIVPATGGTPVTLNDGGSDMYPDWQEEARQIRFGPQGDVRVAFRCLLLLILAGCSPIVIIAHPC